MEFFLKVSFLLKCNILIILLFKEEQLMNKDKDDRLTNWRLIITAAVVSCLNAVENSVLGIGEWPYMREVSI